MVQSRAKRQVQVQAQSARQQLAQGGLRFWPEVRTRLPLLPYRPACQKARLAQSLLRRSGERQETEQGQEQEEGEKLKALPVQQV